MATGLLKQPICWDATQEILADLSLLTIFQLEAINNDAKGNQLGPFLSEALKWLFYCVWWNAGYKAHGKHNKTVNGWIM